MSKPHTFLSTLYDEALLGHLVLWTRQNKQAHWIPAFDLQAAGRLAEQLAPTHDVYFGVALQNKDAAFAKWRAENPDKQVEPPTRGYSETAKALPGLWVDIDVQSLVHRSPHLPPTKEAALTLLDRVPLAPSLVWDTGYGIQALWLLRELWCFGSDAERAEAQLFVKRFLSTLRKLAGEYGWDIDPTYDLGRLLRLPGSWNRKETRPLPVTILRNTSDQCYNQSDFLPFLIELPEPKPHPCIKHSLAALKRDLQRAQEALAYIPADPYDCWLKVGMALHAANAGADGFAVWEAWSRTCPDKFDPEVLHYKWGTFTAPCDSDGSKVTLGTLFVLAKAHGWTPPQHDKRTARARRLYQEAKEAARQALVRPRQS